MFIKTVQPESVKVILEGTPEEFIAMADALVARKRTGREREQLAELSLQLRSAVDGAPMYDPNLDSPNHE